MLYKNRYLTTNNLFLKCSQKELLGSSSFLSDNKISIQPHVIHKVTFCRWRVQNVENLGAFFLIILTLYLEN
jgi:hypothetical protein